MGNCDTHVFLGSNSFKTVEYFSKALGEKTITRGSKSVNRDKNDQRSGYSTSDQIMGRALMTPDELRRMDNDLCIIYETNMAKKLAQYEMSHNEFNIGDRGVWRKYNPYNPYKPEEEKQDLKVESLDDLFEDNSDNKKQNFKNNVDNYENDEDLAPFLPQEDEEEYVEKDLQEELEAKFDELFGPIDED